MKFRPQASHNFRNGSTLVREKKQLKVVIFGAHVNQRILFESFFSSEFLTISEDSADLLVLVTNEKWERLFLKQSIKEQSYVMMKISDSSVRWEQCFGSASVLCGSGSYLKTKCGSGFVP